MHYRNMKTGELAPAHLLGRTDDGRALYLAMDGYEPEFEHETDADGNWIASNETLAKGGGR